MPAKRTTMRKIREILRLRQSAGLSIRQINASTKASVGAIQQLLTRADELGLSWPLPPELDDNQLARLFYPGADTAMSISSRSRSISTTTCTTSSITTRFRISTASTQTGRHGKRPAKPAGTGRYL